MAGMDTQIWHRYARICEEVESRSLRTNARGVFDGFDGPALRHGTLQCAMQTLSEL